MKLLIILALAILIVVLMIGIAATRETPMNEQLYQFKLVRLITLPGGDWIFSKTTVEIGTDDPFRTAGVILKNFPGWELDGFVSETDLEFDDHCEGRR